MEIIKQRKAGQQSGSGQEVEEEVLPRHKGKVRAQQDVAGCLKADRPKPEDCGAGAAIPGLSLHLGLTLGFCMDLQAAQAWDKALQQCPALW